MPAPHEWPLAAGALSLSILFGVAGQLLMKWAALRTVGAPLTWSLVPSLGLALFVYSLGIANWVVALRHLRLSVAYPLTSLNYVGILAGSYYWFGEHVSLGRAAGVAMIFLGVMLITVYDRRSSLPVPTGGVMAAGRRR